MSIKLRTNKKYVVLGGYALREVADGAAGQGAETIVVPEPATDLYSPRTVNLSNNQPELHPGLSIYYSVGMAKGEERRPFQEYQDIYHFVLACRASKSSVNHFLPRPAESPKDLEEGAIIPYNLVGGEKLPPNPPGTTRETVHRYMMMGIHTFWVFMVAGLGQTVVESVKGRPTVISKGGHVFRAGDGSIANTSNLFLAMLVDYYHITSGISGMDSQIAFVRDAEYRLLIFRYLKSVFVSFIYKNKHYLDEASQRINLNETSSGNEETVIRLVVKILSRYLAGE